MSALTISPIGYARTGKRVKFDTPHQPDPELGEENIIELLPHRAFDLALRDLEGFERIWLIWWFDRNETWKPLVTPPRGGAKKRGVFATRSPHRPVPIGMTAVRLLSIKGLRLKVGSLDLLDGTPILDIKPYIAGVDAFPDSRGGWVDELEEALKEPPRYRIEYTELALKQIAWLRDNFEIEFCERAADSLARDPTPHRSRRVRAAGEWFFMGCGAWRVYFAREVPDTVRIECIAAGYPPKALEDPFGYENVPDREAQIAFNELWPGLPEKSLK